jgi:hypothetical protein
MKMRSLSVVGVCFLLMVGMSWEVGAYDKSDLKKLRATKQCNKCNLREVRLIREDLTGANLTGAKLIKADLTEADLTKANLTAADLWRANLTGAKLKEANLTGAKLFRADLTGADLTGANLIGAKLTEANLTGADLTGADLTGANLIGANLTEADLTGINLTEILIDKIAIATNIAFSELMAKKEKKEAEAKRLAKEKRKKEREMIALNPGFRDLKPGLTREEIQLLKVCSPELSPLNSATCYDIDNIKFGGWFSSQQVLRVLTIDLGPYLGGGFIQTLTELSEGDPILNMRGTLGEKYEMDYDFSERDLQLFNESEKEILYTVYAKGQVALAIVRKDYKIRTLVEYRDPEIAKKFLEDNRPKKAKSSDF